MTAVVDEVKRCNVCGQWKPLDAFYLIKGRYRRAMCCDCDNTRDRTQTLTRIIRTRARHRAHAELARRHRDEFRNLLDHYTDAAECEAALIAESERASHAPGGIPRLRPGQRKEGQATEDRINRLWAEVGKCRDCATHHSHGHACDTCGHPQPGQPAEPLPEHRGTCSCPHPARRHTVDDGCLIDGCGCSGHPDADA